MHPILFSIGPITIHTYGFLIALGFIAAMTVIRRFSVKSGLNSEQTLDLTFWSLLIGFIGARLLFVLTQPRLFENDLLGIFRIWEGGLVFYGGPLVVVPFVLWYTRKKRLPLLRTMDVMTLGLVIAHAFGRMGCLAAGCCYGKPTDTTWGIKLYSDLVDVKWHGVNLHPTQIYESLSLFILFFALTRIYKLKRFDGQVVLSYFIAYPIIRSIIEIFRGDLERGFLIDDYLSTSQAISIIVFLVALTVLALKLQKLKSLKTHKK